MFAANIITTFLFSRLYPGTLNPHRYSNIKINKATTTIRRLDELLPADMGECNGGVIYPVIFDDAPLLLGNMSTSRVVSNFILNVRSGNQLPYFEDSRSTNETKEKTRTRKPRESSAERCTTSSRHRNMSSIEAVICRSKEDVNFFFYF